MESIFSHIATAQGWKLVRNIAVGAYEGYPFAIKPETDAAKKSVISFQLNEAIPRKLVKEARPHMPNGCTSQANGQQLNITYWRDDADTDGSGMQLAITTMANALREGGIAPPSTCPFCKGGDCDTLAFVGGFYVPVHRECVAQATAATAEKAVQNEEGGNYITGIIGAFIGGLVGIIPSVLSITLGERIFSLLYALIPICAYQGYKLFRGKLNKTAIISTVIMSVLHLFTLEQVLLYIEFVKTFGYWPNVIDTITLYWSYVSFSEALADMGTSFIFLALGIWIAWGQISHTNKDIVYDLLMTKESMAELGAGDKENYA